MESSGKYYILTAEEYRRLAGGGGQTSTPPVRKDPLVDPLVTSVKKGRAELANADPTASTYDRVLQHAQKLERYLSDIRKLKRKNIREPKRKEIDAALGQLSDSRKGLTREALAVDGRGSSDKRRKTPYEYAVRKRELPYDTRSRAPDQRKGWLFHARTVL